MVIRCFGDDVATSSTMFFICPLRSNDAGPWLNGMRHFSVAGARAGLIWINRARRCGGRARRSGDSVPGQRSPNGGDDPRQQDNAEDERMVWTTLLLSPGFAMRLVGGSRAAVLIWV